ncbi:MAG: inositol-3-phosphate synthase [Thermodesulfobacteriota bacterium]
MGRSRVGVWLIGARGAVATTVAVGALARARGLVDDAGLVTALPLFQTLGLPAVEDLVLGGCDIRSAPVLATAERLAGQLSGVRRDLLPALAAELAAHDRRLSPGITHNVGPAIARLVAGPGPGPADIRAALAAVTADLRRFREEGRLDRLVVINLASTEPLLADDPSHHDPELFRVRLAAGDGQAMRASTLYAWAALEEGCAFINFTPSNGALLPALVEHARQRRLPVMGNDGKTGETLVKSALAPLFASRNLPVLSWEGTNLLGNLDGAVLDDPEHRAAKVRSKDQVLPRILGYAPHTGVHIHFVPSLDDQKTAWDLIHFQGFLGARMSLQFTWQGYDSILAAPLVLDLARLAAYALARGEGGLLPHLACFFKDPLGVAEQRLVPQFALLEEYVRRQPPAADEPQHVQQGIAKAEGTGRCRLG